MKLKLILQRLSAVTVVLTMNLPLPALAQRPAVVHGAPVYHGGPAFHGYRDGGVWWGLGLGLGLGLGWDAGYYGYPYSWYYPPYVYPEPSTVIAPSAAPAQANWYFCNSLKNYYPAVDHCPEQWRIIPETPPTAPTAPATPKEQPAR